MILVYLYNKLARWLIRGHLPGIEDDVIMEIGYALIPLVDKGQRSAPLLKMLIFLRKQGVGLPVMHIKDNIELNPEGYRVLLKNHEIAIGIVLENYHLASDPGTPWLYRLGITFNRYLYKLLNSKYLQKLISSVKLNNNTLKRKLSTIEIVIILQILLKKGVFNSI